MTFYNNDIVFQAGHYTVGVDTARLHGYFEHDILGDNSGGELWFERNGDRLPALHAHPPDPRHAHRPDAVSQAQPPGPRRPQLRRAWPVQQGYDCVRGEGVSDVSIITEINNAHAAYWRDTGRRPTRLYVGRNTSERLRLEAEPYMWSAPQEPHGPGKFMGLDVHIVIDDAEHLFVA